MEKFVNNFTLAVVIISVVAALLSFSFPNSTAILQITGKYFLGVMIASCCGAFILTPIISFGKEAVLHGQMSLTILAVSMILLISSLYMNISFFHLI